MPIYVAMAHSQEPEPPPAGDAPQIPEVKSMSPEDAPSGDDTAEAGITAEELARIVRRMETGFYDRAEIRDQIARRLLDELDP
jgi:hypothetical protein